MYSPNMYNVFNVVFEVVGGGSQPAGQVHKKKVLSTGIIQKAIIGKIKTVASVHELNQMCFLVFNPSKPQV